MAGRIPQSFIDELISRTDIVDLIDSRLPLRKTGRGYVACCPFHHEKTPSFTVSPDKQFYHCFGCGAHGTAIGFLMEYDHLEFPEVVEALASNLGMTVPWEGGHAQRSDSSPDLYPVLEKAASYYQRQLHDHPQADGARRYLQQRGVTGEVLQRYRIGYAPPGWDGLHQALSRDIPRSLLISAGLLVEKEDSKRTYDRFRNRIMFPIGDRRGKIIGFGGRTLGDDTPKYLNSPETVVFHKGSELYGLHQAIKDNPAVPQLLVVEGYMDVVALAQFGFFQAVATLGTATTPDHLHKLFRLTSQVIFAFDGDRAGRQAAWRALETCLPHLQGKREVRFLLLPEGEDPDTLVRAEGQQTFSKRLGNSVPALRFLLEGLQAQVDVSQADGRAQLVELARPWLDKIPAGGYRTLLQEELAGLARVAPQAINKLTNPSLQSTPSPRQSPFSTHQKNAPSRRTPSLIGRAIGLLLQQPALASLAGSPQRFAILGVRGSELLAEMLALSQAQPHLTTAGLLEHWRDKEVFPYLGKLAHWDPLVPAEGLQAEFLGALQRLEIQGIEEETEQLLAKGRISGLTPTEKNRLKMLLQQRQSLP